MTDHARTFLRRFWPSIIVLGFILYATLSSDPIGAEDLPSIPHIDKLIHAVMMGGLTGAIIFDLQRADRSRRLPTKYLIVIAISVMIFSGVDEILQMSIENGRSGEWLDLAADWVGVWVAYFTAPPAVRACLKMN